MFVLANKERIRVSDMKKKIGDLTLNEFKKIKERCSNYKTCKECKAKDKLCYIVCANVDAFINDNDILDQEIEVEVEE